MMAIEVELKAPALLVAVPQLGDPNFVRGVVLVLEHTERGSMGLLLNRPTDLQLGDFARSQNMRWAGETKGLVFQGGPVQQERAFILHVSDHRGPETEDVDGRMRFSYSMESLKLLAETPPSLVRIFLGYAGWGPGQLAEELTAGAWLMGQVDRELVFSAPSDRVWELSLAAMGIDPMLLGHSGAVH